MKFSAVAFSSRCGYAIYSVVLGRSGAIDAPSGRRDDDAARSRAGQARRQATGDPKVRRLRRRHRRAHQLRHRRPGRRAHARQAHRLRQGLMPPHSLVLTMIGASLLWVGWFGFNAGSDLDRGRQAGMAMTATRSSPPRPRRFAWMFVEWIVQGKPTRARHRAPARSRVWSPSPRPPASSGRWAALVLGLVAGVVCSGLHRREEHVRLRRRARRVRRPLHRRHRRRAWSPASSRSTQLGGTGGMIEGNRGAGAQPGRRQPCIVLVYDAVVSLIIFKVIDFIIGLRSADEVEREGLDLADHGERAYTVAPRDTVGADTRHRPPSRGPSASRGPSLFASPAVRRKRSAVRGRRLPSAPDAPMVNRRLNLAASYGTKPLCGGCARRFSRCS